ncbi:MAG TPA: hypothetical protein PLM56_00590 [Cyclobacteriaceae bacterium]|nr:hypothetical protein [Cytophagales bacterium]HMR58448.1 hypothetical protein [Cyclobacteriaceae bacterium]HNT50519.1 hypothetical protein [Cyclobacteriaceae bacterium]HRE66501.1 hypothetical protein [Cyclobacteriaceae bacterium]HRF31965.1 hypothetical protein [Cyclobacteriaceae bacterium]
MLRIKKILRTVLLILLIILALSGIGIAPPRMRELFQNKEDNIELVETQRDESDKD